MNDYKMAGRLTAALFALGVVSLQADVKMPAIFGDHMVLQQDIALPVWGTADAGEKVSVTLGTEKGTATAGADGKWMVKLKPLPSGTAPLTMTVTGKNTLKFDDAVVGDVWICSGQSNMEFGMNGAHNGADAIPKANDPLLRLFLVKKMTSLDPLTDVSGTWMLCTPESVRTFTAVGYFFGQELRAKLNRPIGLIGTYWGGTPAQSWTSLSGLKKEPILKHYVDSDDQVHANFTKAQAELPEKLKAFQEAKTKWDAEVGTAYHAVLKEWTDACEKAKAANQPLPPKPVPSSPPPQQPGSPDGGPNMATNLYNGMIAPLVPYAIKGAIWYQGESNAGAAAEYQTLFPDMITDWREKWGEGNFPFLFVQLAKFHDPNEGFARLREAQLKTLALPNTGMAVAFDVGNQADIHPKDKFDVGLRLALAARHVAYGETLVYSGPLYDKVTITGGKVKVDFTQVGGGLIIGTTPWAPPGVTPMSNATLSGFMIAGDDRKWTATDAVIEGNSVVLSSAEVPKPTVVRYAFVPSEGNLYNKEGLPASPFRTDHDEPPAPATPQPKPASSPAPTNAAPATK